MYIYTHDYLLWPEGRRGGGNGSDAKHLWDWTIKQLCSLGSD